MTEEALPLLPGRELLSLALGTATARWLGTRILFAAVLATAAALGPSGGPFWPLGLLNSLLVLLAVTGLYLLQVRISRQRIFLENMGVSRRLMVGLVLLWSGVLEAASTGLILLLLILGPGSGIP